MKTLLESWERLKEKCYPDGIASESLRREVYQGFLAGALTMGAIVKEISSMPPDEAAAALNRLSAEAWRLADEHTAKLEAIEKAMKNL